MNAVSLKDKIKTQLRGLGKTGFFHIFGATSINRLLGIILSFVLVRIMSKADYGVYAYAFNIASFFIIFNGLGVTSAILQICSELYEKKKDADSVYLYAHKSGVVVDVAMCLFIVTVAIFIPLEIEGSNLVLLAYCAYPLFVLLFDMKTVRMRSLLMNKEYSFVINFQSVLLIVFAICGALLFGAIGLAIGQSLAYLCAYILTCLKYPFKRQDAEKLTREKKKDFWGISGISAINNGLSQALTLTGTFFVGLFIASDAEVASYQVATMIPYGLLFIPGVVMTYAYPYFAMNKDNKEWTCRNYAKIVVASIGVMGLIAILVAVLAEPIVWLLFGEQYLDIVPILRILLIGFFFGAVFRQPAGNLMITQRKLLTNTAIGVMTIVVNVGLSVLLIPSFGMMGAAYTYVATMTVGGILQTACYVWAICHIKPVSTEN